MAGWRASRVFARAYHARLCARISRARFISWAAIAACFVVLCGLAFWQAQRYQEARGWEAARAVYEGQSAENVRRVHALRELADAAPQELLILSGRFLPEPAHYVWTPSPPGWLWMNPFRLERGGMVLVVRGFAAASVFDPQRAGTGAPARTEIVPLQGRVRALPRRVRFAPRREGRIWYALDREEVGQVFPTAAPYLVRTQSAHGFAEDGLALLPPPPAPAPTLPPQRHLGYALTWALLAVALAGLSVYAMVGRRDKPAPKT